jgi:hypothetical protein
LFPFLKVYNVGVQECVLTVESNVIATAALPAGLSSVVKPMLSVLQIYCDKWLSRISAFK